MNNIRQNLFPEILAAIPAIQIFNNKGEIIFVNENAAKMMGFASPKEMIFVKDLASIRKRAAELFDVFDEFGKQMPLECTPLSITLKTGKPAEAILWIITKEDKSSRLVLTQTEPVFDDNGALAMVHQTNTDITNKKTFAEKLERSEYSHYRIKEAK